MRYALISDIHANLPALEAVLADIASREDVGATYYLGDLVGYAPWPNEVIATLRRQYFRYRWELRLDRRDRLQTLRLSLRGSAAGRIITSLICVDA